jgi:phospho-N-acetylmuramoyl-pentapeptide-transferase
MLYRHLFPLSEQNIIFNLFKYITLRTAAGAITAFLISVIFGPYIIRKMASLSIKENVEKGDSPDLYKLHQSKAETPTMGGLLILMSIVVSTALWADICSTYVLLALVVVVGLGAVGALDDVIKLRSKAKGLSITQKLVLQTVVCLGIALVLWSFLRKEDWGTSLQFPFFKHATFSLGALYIVFVAIVLVGSSNAVNLTDGLDGLAIGCTTMVSLSLMVIAYVVGRYDASQYLWIQHIPGAGELTIFAAAVAGSGVGFLWFNCHPADVFMGDTGALPLGAALGYIAVVTKHELLLFLVGGVFVTEAVSVLLQVASFRLRGTRVFSIAPLHHHFQFRGWPEERVVVRFWIIGAILAIAGICTLKLR